jgi:signal transduction histidine kinase
VTLSFCVFAVTLLFAITGRFPRLGIALQAGVISMMGAAGIALAALQPRDATSLAGAAAVWMAVARLPEILGALVAAAITAGLTIASAVAGASAGGVLATILLCGLLALIARFLRQSRESQGRTEVLLARLEDAQEEQAKTAAVAERNRIASELHDVLAHSLSGAAIQLQGARMLAEREHAPGPLRDALENASDQVRHGLAEARQAVSALRGAELPNVAQLPALIDSVSADLHVQATLRVRGPVRELPADASLARGAQEALTNVARYAPGAATAVVLSYEPERTTLVVEDHVSGAAAQRDGRFSGGGGRGLAGMRERVERAGGRATAGPTECGWRVELEVPA